AYFFGREQLVGELAAKTVGCGLLGVVGPSGSGKSSVVLAGLVPSLAAGLLPGSERWDHAVLRPGERGSAAPDDALTCGRGGARQAGWTSSRVVTGRRPGGRRGRRAGRPSSPIDGDGPVVAGPGGGLATVRRVPTQRWSPHGCGPAGGVLL